jgi:hypothetical protein
MLQKTYGNLADLDIQPQNINFYPSHPTIGNSFFITATVENTGYTEASSIKVQFFNGDPYNGNQQIGSDIIIPAIPAQGFSIASSNWIMPGTTSDIYISLDPDSTISELTQFNTINYRTLTSQTT